MADILLRKQQGQLWPRTSSSWFIITSWRRDRTRRRDTSSRRVRTSSPTSATTAVQSSLPHDTLIVLMTRRHRPKASIIVTTPFSIPYFMSLFTSKIDVLLPSYIKSASESVHQLYRTSPEAYRYLDYLEQLAHPTVQFCKYIVSMTAKAASGIGDIGGLVGGVVSPTSPHLSSQWSPPSPPQPTGPLDYLHKLNIIKMFSDFHIKRDATDLAPPSVDIKDIYNQFFTPVLDVDLDLEHAIARYFKPCPPHQNDQRIAFIALYEDEFRHFENSNHIQLANINPLMQHGFSNLYQHIHLHQQATDAINFNKITWSLLLGANDKIPDNFKETLLRQQPYLVAILVHPHSRKSSQHQEFELN